MCTLAKIPGHYTNHSLRATGATALYTAGVPEKDNSGVHWAPVNRMFTSV